MGDVFDSEKRSEVMSLIRSKNTKSEMIVFKYLRFQKIYFQKHYNRIKGSPDIALPRKKKAVFIDGDFWHGRTFKALLKRRGNKQDYWVIKIANNMERDLQTRKQLIDSGWQILVVWDSDIKRKSTRLQTLEKIKNFLISDKTV